MEILLADDDVQVCYCRALVKESNKSGGMLSSKILQYHIWSDQVLPSRSNRTHMSWSTHRTAQIMLATTKFTGVLRISRLTITNWSPTASLSNFSLSFPISWNFNEPMVDAATTHFFMYSLSSPAVNYVFGPIPRIYQWTEATHVFTKTCHVSHWRPYHPPHILWGRSGMFFHPVSRHL